MLGMLGLRSSLPPWKDKRQLILGKECGGRKCAVCPKSYRKEFSECQIPQKEDNNCQINQPKNDLFCTNSLKKQFRI